jgi:hypothetical protein
MKKQILKDILDTLDKIEKLESILFSQGIKNVILDRAYYSGCELACLFTGKDTLNNHDLFAYLYWLDRFHYLKDSIAFDIKLKKIESSF